MDQSKFNQVIKAVNSLNNFMIEGYTDYDQLGKKVKQFMQANDRRDEPVYERINQEELNYIEKVHQEQPSKTSVKQVKNKLDKGNEGQIQKYRLHQQEVDLEQDKIRKQEEAYLDYWREAILLSEIIGAPVAMRRRGKRMESR